MPPKKKEEEKKVLLGRPGNSLKSGIVGLANVGKSTLFQAITKSNLGNPAVRMQLVSNFSNVHTNSTRTFPMPPSTLKKPASSFLMNASTG